MTNIPKKINLEFISHFCQMFGRIFMTSESLFWALEAWQKLNIVKINLVFIFISVVNILANFYDIPRGFLAVLFRLSKPWQNLNIS